MSTAPYTSYLAEHDFDPDDAPKDLRALWELDASDEAFFRFADYGEVELLTGEPAIVQHYVDSAQGDAWAELFEDILWIAVEAEDGLIGYYQPEDGLDHVVYLDNEGTIRTTGRRLVDHFAWVNYRDQSELDAFCEEAGLEPPASDEERESAAADLPDPEARLFELLEEVREAQAAQQSERARPVDRSPQIAPLPDGRLLVISNDDEIAESDYDAQAAFVFDPATTSFHQIADTPFKAYHSACLPGVLEDGRVPLLDLGNPVQLVFFDPASEEWLEGPGLDANHKDGAAVLLQDGRIAAFGPRARVDVYDPTEDAWTTAADLPNMRASLGAVVLDDGRVLTVGGTNYKYRPQRDCDIWNPATDEWTQAADLPSAQSSVSLQLLADGRVLMMRGSEHTIYDPETDTWTEPDEVPGAGPTMATLPDGRVAMFRKQSVVFFDPDTDEFTEAGSLTLKRDSSSQAFVLPDGRVLLVGGTLYNNIANEPEIWDPETGQSSAVPGFEKEFEKQKKALAKRE